MGWEKRITTIPDIRVQTQEGQQRTLVCQAVPIAAAILIIHFLTILEVHEHAIQNNGAIVYAWVTLDTVLFEYERVETSSDLTCGI